MRYLGMVLALGIGLQLAWAGGAAKVEWTTDLDKMKIPNRPASGKLLGQDFKVEGVKLQGGVLTLRQGKDFFPDMAVLIFLQLRPGDDVAGKTFEIPAADTPDPQRPHIHLQRRPPGEKLPKGQAFVTGYAMKLAFGKEALGRVPARIYLCVPDETKSVVAGTFSVDLK
jgi:hypothetical protein